MFTDDPGALIPVELTSQPNGMLLEDLKLVGTKASSAEQKVLYLEAVISSTRTKLEALEKENAALRKDLKTVLEHRSTLDTMKNLVDAAVNNIVTAKQNHE